jgi:hypothetical protein
MPGCGVALVRRVAGVGRGGRWLVAAGPLARRRRRSASSSPPTAPVDRSEATLSKLARTLVLAATLTVMDPAGMTAVAQAQVKDKPTRPPIEFAPSTEHPMPQ